MTSEALSSTQTRSTEKPILSVRELISMNDKDMSAIAAKTSA